MNRMLLVLPVLAFVFGLSNAYAEPLEDINVSVIEYDGVSATVQTTWNNDASVVKYELGCVSCMPNTAEFTSEDGLTMTNVTPFPNTSNVMLYVIAYDAEDEILHAQQILVNLDE